jgi:Flp pilus assembly pilin Flp
VKRWLDHQRRADGATAVEFALILPALIALLLGIFEFGRALHTRSALDYLADSAARSLSVQYRGTALVPADLETALAIAARADAPGLDAALLRLAVIPDGNALRVEVSYDFDFLIPLIPVAPITLSARRLVPMP